ncbi:Alpha/beta hydrolase family protein [Sulfitobacter sp. THAF37]|uniref:alpha/beta hydrolase n=1 Tax=Sulfitobacter sp. THAF37 TaxID=2587855 RepID=UPI001268B2D5|nr:alpha/beta fold hydrolase [Sulfitobacter sp. THAF37]QFT59718.1 Alpha/beta hydrolase family protein [Sulfitobacter sp. THAF37]
MIFTVLKFVAISVAITGAIALILIASQRPGPRGGAAGLDFSGPLSAAGAAAQPQETLPLRDGFEMQLRSYDSGREGAPLLVLVHGSGWHGLQFDRLARRLSARADVLVPDLRGHGAEPGRRGDLDYIGQFEDDLADLIAARRRPGQKIVLGGHSSGGGLVVRFAGGPHGQMLDGAVLLAPFLKHDAPPTRPNSGGWAQPLTRRLIGLSMLNAAGISALNHLAVIQFNIPQEVLDGPLGRTATTAYSYRLNTSYAPRGDYLADVKALPPFLLVAGTADEAFDAAAYQPTMETATDRGRYLLVPDIGHLDIVDAPETAAAIEDFLDAL